MRRIGMFLALAAMVAVAFLLLGREAGLRPTSTEANTGIDNISLVRKPPSAKVFVKDQIVISVSVNDPLTGLTDKDGDTKAGYAAWEALVVYDSADLTLKTPISFRADGLDITTSTPPAACIGGTLKCVILGASIGTAENESTQTGNVANLTFAVLEGAAGGTKVFIPKGGARLLDENKANLLDDGANVSFKAAVASVTLSAKSGCKTMVPNKIILEPGNECRVPQGGKVTISVNFNNKVAATLYKAVVNWTGDPGTITLQNPAGPTLPQPPCNLLATKSAPAAGTTTRECKDDTPANGNYANVFDIVLKCTANAGSTAPTSTISLGLQTGVTTIVSPAIVTNYTGKDNVNVSAKAITVRCMGATSNRDLPQPDACDAAEEAAISALLNPNRYDIANAVDTIDLNDVRIDDILAYVTHFGHNESSHNPQTTGQNPKKQPLDLPFDGSYDGNIGADDVTAAVLQFGITC